jgi:hypothetical protein
MALPPSSNPTSTRGDTSTTQSNSTPHQKIMITGDDILIEYVSRLMNAFSTDSIREENLTEDQT